MGLTYPNCEHAGACFCIRFPIPSQHFKRGAKDPSRIVDQRLILLCLLASSVTNINPNYIKSHVISTSSNNTNSQCAILQPSSSFSWLLLLPRPSPRRRLYPYRTKYVKPAQTRWMTGHQCNALIIRMSDRLRIAGAEGSGTAAEATCTGPTHPHLLDRNGA